LLIAAGSAVAQGADAMSGEYMCSYGCRVTDAAPSVKIDREAAICTNELGGIFYGRVLTETSITCFNKTGALSPDRKTIRWDGGMVWTRVR
jgi:hypothetical protein